ncbi:MAG: hypothetical protein R3B89_07420 [Polyangiaceae bacterium]
MGDGWRWVALVVLGAVSVACGSSDDATSEQPTSPEPTDPLQRGAFEVGVTTWTLSDGSRRDEAGNPRSLKVEIWYPATEAAAALPRDEYDLLEEAPPDIAATLGDVSTTSIAQDAARDADLLDTFAPYPLVVFSHGNGGLRFQNFSICSHLASHGFVVVAPDHTGDTTWEAIDGGLGVAEVLEAFPERAADLPFVAEALVETKGPLEGAAQADNWAMMGHSFGASMSLALTEEHNGIEPDARFRAAVPMTPASSILPLFGYGVEKSRVPTLIFGAQRDGTLDFEAEQVAAYDGIPTDKVFAAVKEAGHFSYTDLCRPELQDLAQALGEDVGNILGDGCGEDFIDPESMLTIQRYLVTHFLEAELRAGAESRAALSPGALPASVATPIDYQTSGFE